MFDDYYDLVTSKHVRVIFNTYCFLVSFISIVRYGCGTVGGNETLSVL